MTKKVNYSITIDGSVNSPILIPKEDIEVAAYHEHNRNPNADEKTNYYKGEKELMEKRNEGFSVLSVQKKVLNAPEKRAQDVSFAKKEENNEAAEVETPVAEVEAPAPKAEQATKSTLGFNEESPLWVEFVRLGKEFEKANEAQREKIFDKMYAKEVEIYGAYQELSSAKAPVDPVEKEKLSNESLSLHNMWDKAGEVRVCIEQGRPLPKWWRELMAKEASVQEPKAQAKEASAKEAPAPKASASKAPVKETPAKEISTKKPAKDAGEENGLTPEEEEYGKMSWGCLSAFLVIGALIAAYYFGQHDAKKTEQEAIQPNDVVAQQVVTNEEGDATQKFEVLEEKGIVVPKTEVKEDVVVPEAVPQTNENAPKAVPVEENKAPEAVPVKEKAPEAVPVEETVAPEVETQKDIVPEVKADEKVAETVVPNNVNIQNNVNIGEYNGKKVVNITNNNMTSTTNKTTVVHTANGGMVVIGPNGTTVIPGEVKANETETQSNDAQVQQPTTLEEQILGGSLVRDRERWRGAVNKNGDVVEQDAYRLRGENGSASVRTITRNGRVERITINANTGRTR